MELIDFFVSIFEFIKTLVISLGAPFIVLIISSVLAIVMFFLRKTQEDSLNMTLYHFFDSVMYISIAIIGFSLIFVIRNCNSR